MFYKELYFVWFLNYRRLARKVGVSQKQIKLKKLIFVIVGVRKTSGKSDSTSDVSKENWKAFEVEAKCRSQFSIERRNGRKPRWHI